MKDELKTLKDMRYWSDKNHLIDEKELKAEAVKWVKFYSKDLEDEYAQFMRMWIWKFFNLTEEELKK